MRDLKTLLGRFDRDWGAVAARARAEREGGGGRRGWGVFEDSFICLGYSANSLGRKMTKKPSILT